MIDIIQESGKNRQKAKLLLEIAKKKEKEKLDNGYIYVNIDRNTQVLKKK